MTALPASDLYSDLMSFLFFIDGAGDPNQRQGMLTAAGFAALAPQVTFYGPAQVFCSGLVKALANQGQQAVATFLEGLRGNPFVGEGATGKLGQADTARLESLKQAVSSLPQSDWQTYFLGQIRTYLFMPADL